MKEIAVVYHSAYSANQQIAQQIGLGIEQENISWFLLTAQEAKDNLSLLDNVKAIIFGTPTYFGGVSADFKQFMDATSQTFYTRKWHNKIAAGFTNSSSYSGDKLSTLIQLSIFAAQHSMIWTGSDLTVAKQGEPENRLGSWLGLMSQSDKGIVNKEDLQQAIYFGKRIANIVKTFFKE